MSKGLAGNWTGGQRRSQGVRAAVLIPRRLLCFVLGYRPEYVHKDLTSHPTGLRFPRWQEAPRAHSNPSWPDPHSGSSSK